MAPFGFVRLAMLPDVAPVALLEAGAAETPEPSSDGGDGLHVSAMCFTLATLNVLPDELGDCVWPALGGVEALVLLLATLPMSCTLWPTCCFRSLVAPVSW